jgi:hypothetical protein
MASLPQVIETPTSSLSQALGFAYHVALSHHPKEAARIQRGHAIALQGDVRCYGSGLAEVQSQSQSQTTTWYVVNGRCYCPDSGRAPQGRCKHRWAAWVLTWAQTHLAQQNGASAPQAPKTLYHIPRWKCYEATYQGPCTAMQPVNGIAKLLEADRFFFQPDHGGYGWEAAYHEVALGPGIADKD